MLVICDGGSTKADWIVRMRDGSTLSIATTGFNPNYDSTERITTIIHQELAAKLGADEPGAVYYYGAGCKDAGKKAIVQAALSGVFTHTRIEVNHDMLAAARATCGNEPGIVCILGTGSNSVLFDGWEEIDQVTNLGFLLGDEGSGSQIGKRLVQAYFYREMPAEFHPIMQQICPNGRKDILEKVYGGGVPAAYLASYVKLFTPHQNHPYIRQLVKDCFIEFLTRHVCKYENHETLPVHFVGSIAWYFSQILQEALAALHLRIGVILHKPAQNLFQYHLSREQFFF
jgi:N-acetylglucosamine kinase-like BadF-type ATPase